jgi:hypothetical protein
MSESGWAWKLAASGRLRFQNKAPWSSFVPAPVFLYLIYIHLVKQYLLLFYPVASFFWYIFINPMDFRWNREVSWSTSLARCFMKLYFVDIGDFSVLISSYLSHHLFPTLLALPTHKCWCSPPLHPLPLAPLPSCALLRGHPTRPFSACEPLMLRSKPQLWPLLVSVSSLLLPSEQVHWKVPRESQASQILTVPN